MNETELVERCGKGDNLARKQLYERYAGQLMAICVRYTGDREVAQDVLHVRGEKRCVSKFGRSENI